MSERIDRILTQVYCGVNAGLTIDEAVADMNFGDQAVFENWSQEVIVVDYLR